ncbi:MAG: DUF3368 domain-containing protein [Methanomicrobiales archaeon]|nr:DUF3368 domain-containing protein [Methanomicrobiales archaeon]
MVEPSDKTLVLLLEQELHLGEAESIALALEIRPDILLLDESEARRVAGLYDLPVTGIIGLLIQARHEGRISSLAEEMDRLRGEGGFWIREELYQHVLEMERDG